MGISQELRIASYVTLPDKLITEQVRFSRKIKVHETFRMILPDELKFDSGLDEIEVYAGYESDGASIPRILWSAFPPYGKYLEAAVIHDYIYTDLFDVFTKKQADLIFKHLLKVLDQPSWKVSSMYRSVRIFGKGAW